MSFKEDRELATSSGFYEGKKSIYDRDEQDDLNDQHLDNPQVGDYWHDCFTPILVVVGHFRNKVVICKTTKAGASKDRWTWDLDCLELTTSEEMRSGLTYGSNRRLAGRCWARVEPEAHKWVERVDAT